MSTNPSPGQNPDQSNQYGGYTGYTPPAHNDASGSGNQQADAGQDYQYGQQRQPYNYGQQQQQSYPSGQQQQNTYQPPLSALKGASGASGSAATGAQTNKRAVWSYALWFLSGLFFFITERKDRFVRFCAAQSFLFFGAVTLVYIVLQLIHIIPVIGTVLLAPVIGCAIGVLLVPAVLIWVFLMVQARRGVKVKLPFFGNYAESLVERFTKK